MTTQLQIRRGSTLENDSFIGAEGEITYDIQEKNLHIHDGLTPGGKLVGTNHFAPNIFDHKWADHVLNDVSWIRADSFSWQNGTLYKAAYDHLLNDFENGTSQTETVAGITIPYKKASDGHKIIEPTTEALDALTRIYNTTGIAWYYILDVENQRFKLPRTTFGFTGIRNGVGNYTGPGLPNITGIYNRHSGYANIVASNNSSGAFYFNGSGYWGKSLAVSDGNYTVSDVGFDASRSNSIYGSSNTVQSPATQMYLYFYVGEFVHTPLVNNVTNTWISNCITQIPQDINLELDNGTLVLKAGSKVYVPNGAGVFDLITTTQDCSISGTIGANNNKVFIAYRNNAITTRPVSSSVSGADATTVSGFAFDTTANKINFYNASGALQSTDWSFPIAIVSTNYSGSASSIDQVFNGFGYIGSTAFVLPGVRGLIPDGRNEDGSYKSKELIIQDVKVSTIAENGGSNRMFLNDNGISARGVNYYISDTKPVINETTCIWYDTLNNFMYTTTDSGTTWNSLGLAIYLGILKKTTNSTQITTCIPEAPFKAQGRGDIISLLDMIYPIGAIYLGTQNTCPMSIAIPGSQWALVATDRALWGGNGSNANTTIAAGLPNITGNFANGESEYHRLPIYNASGCFTNGGSSTIYTHDIDGGWNAGRLDGVQIAASRSSSVYGNSTTVQPPAYRVNVWRRTA